MVGMVGGVIARHDGTGGGAYRVQVASAEDLILDVGPRLLRLVRTEVKHLGSGCAEHHAVDPGSESDAFDDGGIYLGQA